MFFQSMDWILKNITIIHIDILIIRCPNSGYASKVLIHHILHHLNLPASFEQKKFHKISPWPCVFGSEAS